MYFWCSLDSGAVKEACFINPGRPPSEDKVAEGGIADILASLLTFPSSIVSSPRLLRSATEGIVVLRA